MDRRKKIELCKITPRVLLPKRFLVWYYSTAKSINILDIWFHTCSNFCLLVNMFSVPITLTSTSTMKVLLIDALVMLNDGDLMCEQAYANLNLNSAVIHFTPMLHTHTFWVFEWSPGETLRSVGLQLMWSSKVHACRLLLYVLIALRLQTFMCILAKTDCYDPRFGTAITINFAKTFRSKVEVTTSSSLLEDKQKLKCGDIWYTSYYTYLLHRISSISAKFSEIIPRKVIKMPFLSLCRNKWDTIGKSSQIKQIPAK